MIDLSTEALLTVGGVALFVAIVTQMFVKPALAKSQAASWYGLVLNTISGVLGVAGAVVAAAALGPLEFASAVDAVLVGLSGTAVAIYGYEGIKHTKSYLGKE
jgi:hypothetical protein